MQKFKHLFLTLALTLASCIAIAQSPTVQDVQQAIAAHNAPLVESLAHQVLSEHPNSARAHYYLAQAYLYENRQVDALAQLQKAQQLDSTLGFAASAGQFNKMLAQAQQGIGGVAQVQHANVVQVQHGADSSNTVWWLLGAGLVVVMVSVLIINSVAKRRREIEQAENNRLLAQIEVERAKKATNTVTDAQLERAQRANYYASDILRYDIYHETAPAPRVVNNYYPNSNAQHTSSGSTVGGFVAGAAVGYLANEILSNHHAGSPSSSSTSDDNWNSSSSSSWDTGSSSSSWDSGSSSSSGDSGSSSSDWGSSSSSSDSSW